MKYIFLAGLLAFLMACGEQDPLKEFPDDVRTAVLISQKIEGPPSTPVASDSMAIDGPEVVNFTEGQKGTFKVSGRLLGVEAEHEIKIVNPPEGMTFDAETGQVSWTPPTSTVTGEDNYFKYLLNVDLLAYKEAESLTIRKVIVLFINIDSPPLSAHLLNIAVEPRPVKFTEGKRGSFKLLGQLFSGVKASYQINLVDPPAGVETRPIEGGIEVSWTPPVSTVKGTDQFVSLPIQTQLVAQKEDDTISIRKTIDVGVYASGPSLAANLLEITFAPALPKFVEGREGKFVVTGKLLGGLDASYEISLLNLPPEAKQKSVPGGVEVTWTPPVTTVKGTDQFVSLPIQAQLVAQKEDDTISIRKTIDVGVYASGPSLAANLLEITFAPALPKFVEGREGKFVVTGKLLGGLDASYEISLLNLPPEAKQKSVPGGVEVTWTPPVTTVKGTDQFVSLPIQAQLVAQKEDDTISIRKTIDVGVYASGPSLAANLLEITFAPALPKFVEGREGKFVVTGKLLGGLDASYEISLLNLPPEAKQKSVPGGVEVTWTPPFTTVKGTDQFVSLPIQAQLVAQKEDDTISIRKTIDVGVYASGPSLAANLLEITSNPARPNFVEGEEESFVISGQLLGGLEASYEINILNLPEGATQKSTSTGIEVTWTPALNTVSSIAEKGQFLGTHPLEVQLTARNEEGEITISRTIPLGIQVAYPPLEPDLLAIDVEPKIVNLMEGVEGKFTIRGKVFGPSNASQELTILNPPPGAKQRPVSGGIEVTWTPAPETVPNDSYFTQYFLQTQLSARVGEKEVVKPVSIPLWVRTDTSRAPIIENVTFSKSPIPENEQANMVITVLDRSTGAPTLHFVPVTEGDKNGIYFVKYEHIEPTPDPEVPDRWHYTVGIDFNNSNITSKAFADIELGAVAYSRYGVPSSIHSFSYRVLNKILPPETHWRSEISLPYGRELNFKFAIMDPRMEGIIKTNFEETCAEYLVKHYSCKCKRSPGTNLTCTLDWFAFEKAPRKINFSYWASNTSPYDKTDTQTKSFGGVIKLYREK